MRSYVLAAMGPHLCTVLFFCGIGNSPQQWINIFQKFQNHDPKPIARGTRVILLRAPISANGRETHWYDPNPMMREYAGGPEYNTDEINASARVVKALVAHEHVVNKVPLNRIVTLGYSHGAGLVVYAALHSLLHGTAPYSGLRPYDPADIVPAPRFPDGIGPNGRKIHDTFPSLPEAMMLKNYDVDLTKLANTVSFASRMAGTAVLANRAKAYGCPAGAHFPRMSIVHGVSDTMTPLAYHHAVMKYIESIYESCGAKMEDYVSVDNTGSHGHTLESSKFMYIVDRLGSADFAMAPPQKSL